MQFPPLKHTYLALALALPVFLPFAAEARPVRITTTLKNYSGDGAYVAIYLTDTTGKFIKTLHVAGKKAKYFSHLSAWQKQSGGRIDGTTGASVGVGQSLRINAEIADALIEAGFEIRVDAAAEDLPDAPLDARISGSNAKPSSSVGGRRYVQSLRIDM